MTQPVVLVDAYSSGRRLAPAFAEAGHECVHLQSMPAIPAVYARSFEPDRYRRLLVHDGDLDATLRAVASVEPVAVVAASEPGVELADLLSERLGLRSNGTALSSARRDKHRMAERVRAAGLEVAAGLVTASERELATWVEARPGRVVVKPLRSAGNDGVFFCDTPSEAVAALRSLLGSRSALHGSNAAVLVQEYLPGGEYYLNTVSLDGRHHVCDIWKTSHITANGVLDLLEGSYLLPPRGAEQDPLVAYGTAVLDALGIRHGPAHMELKATPAGPRLIEVGARVCGGDMPHLARQAVGEAQIEWTVDAYVRPERFRARCDEPYEVERYAAIIGMICPFAGTLRAYHGLERIRALDSFHEVKLLVQPGEPIVPTVDDFTFPVVVSLLHEVAEIVARDFATVRYLDGSGFFSVDQAAVRAPGATSVSVRDGGTRWPARR